MKKILSAIICFCLILSVCGMSAVAQTNYCQLFNDQLGGLAFVKKFGNEENPWTASDIAFMTSWNLKNLSSYRNADKDTEFEEVYSVPKAEFEALAKKLFYDIKADLTTANYNGMRAVRYDAEAQTYDIILKPAGGGAHYHICGYQQASEKYIIYMQLVDYEEYLEEYIKCVAFVEGGYAKLVSCKKTDSVPPEKELITFNTDFSDSTVSSSQPTSSSEPTQSEDASSKPGAENKVWVKNDDVKIEAPENVLPKGAKITASKITETARIATIIKDLSEKFVAFDITATNGNKTVKPDGKVTVTFKIPEGYEAESTVVLYVADGAYEILNSTVDAENRTITAKLSHFSTYVVAQKTTETVSSEDTTSSKPETTTSKPAKPNNDKKEESGSVWPTIIAVVVALAVIGGAGAWYFLYFKKINKK